MSTVTEEATATAAADDVVSPWTGLSEEEELAILQGQAHIFRVCHAWAVRDLTAQRPAAVARLEEAEGKLTQARARFEGPQAIVEHLQGELAECRRLADTVQLAAEDADLSARIAARSTRAAYAEEIAALEERARTAVRVCDPLAMVLLEAERETKAARGDLADLDRAIAFPFGHPRGRATQAHARYMLDTGMWMRDIRSGEATAVIMEALRLSGVGDRVQREAIAAYVSGHPAALAAGGGTKRWRDGTALFAPPDGPPVVVSGAATVADLATVPGVNTVPGPPAAEVLGGIRSGAGWPA